jgi:hypothetical protein
LAIKAADVIHVGRGSYLLSRLQNVGPGGLQIPTEVIKEVGNYKSVATLRDVPDLSFTMNSFDVSTTIEQLLTDTASVTSAGIDMTFMKALTVLGQIKPGVTAGSPYSVVKSVACPVLYPERISYRFAVQQTSTVDVTLRGDAVFYNPGPAFQQIVAGSGSSGQTIVTAHPAGLYTKQGTDTRILSVDVDSQRLEEGVDYTVTVASGSETAPYTVATVHLTSTYTSGQKITVVYFSSDSLSYLQSVHPTADDLPAANKGKDVRIYVGATYDPDDVAGSASSRWTGVQSATVDLAQTIIRDYELGNSQSVSVEPQDVPTLSGVVSVRARNATELFTRLRQITGVTDVDKAIGPDNAVELPLDIVALDSTGTVFKRLHIADARFSLPGYSAQVGNRVDFDLNWTSDTGTLKVFSE